MKIRTEGGKLGGMFYLFSWALTFSIHYQRANPSLHPTLQVQERRENKNYRQFSE
jgi:hypothetical protein